jgi:hypothetical protein
VSDFKIFAPGHGTHPITRAAEIVKGRRVASGDAHLLGGEDEIISRTELPYSTGQEAIHGRISGGGGEYVVIGPRDAAPARPTKVSRWVDDEQDDEIEQEQTQSVTVRR